MQDERDKTLDRFEALKLLYEINADQFKYFLTWRHLMLAGYFPIMAALGLSFKWALEKSVSTLYLFPFIGAWISALFWALDRRNRMLYKMTSEAGALIEEKMNLIGAGQFSKFASGPKTRLGHGTTLSIFYLGSGAFLLMLGLILL